MLKLQVNEYFIQKHFVSKQIFRMFKFDLLWFLRILKSRNSFKIIPNLNRNHYMPGVKSIRELTELTFKAMDRQAARRLNYVLIILENLLRLFFDCLEEV